MSMNALDNNAKDIQNVIKVYRNVPSNISDKFNINYML